MNAQKIIKFIWEELTAFLSWAVHTLWNMYAQESPKEELHVTGVIETEDGYIFTMYSDGTTESGPPGIDRPFV